MKADVNARQVVPRRPVFQNVYANTLLISKPSGTYCALKVEKIIHTMMGDTRKKSNYSPRTRATRPHTTSSTGSQTLSVVQAVAELPSWRILSAESSVAFASMLSSPMPGGSRRRISLLRKAAASELMLVHAHELRRRRSTRKYHHHPCLHLCC